MSIRIATESDLPQILEIYRPYVENTTYSFEYDAPSFDAFRARFLGITKQFPWLVWEESGVILGYAYAMAPYILAENPDISGVEALRLSRQMMKGHKWELFWLEHPELDGIYREVAWTVDFDSWTMSHEGRRVYFL